MKKIILFCLIFWSISANAQNFLDISLDSALVKAEVEQKQVLLYFTAKWCGSCKKMEKTVFIKDSVKQLFQQHHIPLKIDRDSWQGEKLAKEFNIAILPTFLIVSPQRTILRRQPGSLEAEFMAFLIPNVKEEKSVAELSEKEKEAIDFSKSIRKPFLPEIGLRLGTLFSSISNVSNSNNISIDAELSLAMQKNRFLVRPAIGYKRLKIGDTKLNYLKFPIDIGLTIHKGAIFNLSGGYRLLSSLSYAHLLNSKDKTISKNDLGTRFGVGAFIGDTSKLELNLFYEMGLKDIHPTLEGRQFFRGFHWGLLLTL
jgi:thioredoxin-related protein